jgi:hypothetical protein
MTDHNKDNPPAIGLRTSSIYGSGGRERKDSQYNELMRMSLERRTIQPLTEGFYSGISIDQHRSKSTDINMRP